MSSFRQLCSISVTHTYFADGRCRSLLFVPTPGTVHLIAKAGLLTRCSDSGVRVLLEADGIDTLRQRIADPDEPSALVFKVFAKDPDFPYYTEPGIFNEEALLYFDSRTGVATGSAGTVRLHAGDYVSELDFAKLDAPLFSGVVDKRDRLIRPAFVVSMDLALALDALADAPATDRSGDCVVAFKARETFWRYYLLGEMQKRNAVIVDRNHDYVFAYVGEESLPDNRTALTFISQQRIPVQENSDCHFQLKENGANGGKMLVRRLPVATPHQFSKELVNGREAAVSNIYINC